AGPASARGFPTQRAEPEPVLAAPGRGAAAQGGGRGGLVDQERGRRAEPAQGRLKPAGTLLREIDDAAAGRVLVEAGHEVVAGKLHRQALARHELDIGARQAGPARLDRDPQPAGRAADGGARVQSQAHAAFPGFEAELHGGPPLDSPLCAAAAPTGMTSRPASHARAASPSIGRRPGGRIAERPGAAGPRRRRLRASGPFARRISRGLAGVLARRISRGLAGILARRASGGGAVAPRGGGIPALALAPSGIVAPALRPCRLSGHVLPDAGGAALVL